MDEQLYLHEIIDIVGQGAVPYMEHTAGFHAETAAGRGLTLFGTWAVVGATGRWPQVVNLWEILDGWDGWERLLRTTNVRREENAELRRWWDEAAAYRTGGVDRLLTAAPGSPNLAQVTEAAIHGEMFVHELARVRPGSATDYLSAVIDQRAPLMKEYGHRLVGAYAVLMTDDEVVTLWATTLRDHVDFMRRRDIDTPIRAWRASARALLTGWREELMVPHRGTPLAAER